MSGIRGGNSPGVGMQGFPEGSSDPLRGMTAEVKRGCHKLTTEVRVHPGDTEFSEQCIKQASL